MINDNVEFQALWDAVAPLVEKSLDRCADGTWQVDDVREAVLDGRCQFWPGGDAVAISELLHFPRKTALNVWIVGGNMQTLYGMFPSFEAFARANNCYAIYGSGRKGWQRQLMDLGFHSDYHVCKFLE